MNYKNNLNIQEEKATGVEIKDNRNWLAETSIKRAWRDFIFECCWSFKFFWLWKKLKIGRFMYLKDWVKIRLQNKKYEI